MTRIKVCGITDERDAIEAVHLGADAIGFVLAPRSPRYLPPREAGRIGGRLPPFVARVGVFEDQPAAEVAEAIHAAALTCVQFQGREPAEYCRRFPITWWRAFDFGPGFDPAALAEFPCTTYLLAARSPARGDWSLARAAGRYGRIILGGALTPEEVGAAVREARPYAVDAAAGVEFTPGKPDIDRLESFIQAVREADAAGGEPGSA
jgi:phosphoribosylanthranilate isomerase